MTKPVEGTDAANEWEAAALDELLSFPLVDALFGRRSRRFFLGAVIPDGPLAHESRFAPFPLSELERLLIVSAVAGKTGWHSSITRHQRYAPHLSNYPAAAGGRTFPSAAGFHTSEVFFTDDSGTYFVRTRDIAPPTERQPDGLQDVPALVRAHAGQIERLSDARLHIPPHEPYMEGHNSWVANRPGTLLVFPVGDVAQHALLSSSSLRMGSSSTTTSTAATSPASSGSGSELTWTTPTRSPSWTSTRWPRSPPSYPPPPMRAP